MNGLIPHSSSLFFSTKQHIQQPHYLPVTLTSFAHRLPTILTTTTSNFCYESSERDYAIFCGKEMRFKKHAARKH
jgi:hypothetical protein